MTKLELAAIRLYKARLADKQRKAKMNKLVCEREFSIAQNKPCWKVCFDDGDIKEGRTLTSEASMGSYRGTCISDWCHPCQARQELYLDRSVRKELGNAKRSFWAITRSLLKGNNEETIL